MHSFQGTIDCIDGEEVYVRFTDGTGREFSGTLTAARVRDAGLDVGSDFEGSIEPRDDGSVTLALRPLPPRILSATEWALTWEEAAELKEVADA